MENAMLQPRLCTCGNKISGADSHSVCAACLGLQHARYAVADTVTCDHCARLSEKTRRRRLARQASLAGENPVMGVTIPVPQKESEERPRGVTSTELSWSMQMDAEHPLSDPDELDLGLGASGDNLVEFPDSGDEPISLPSEEDEDLIMEQFTLTQATRPGSATASSGSPTPPAAQSLHEVCRRAAAKLGIEWPEAPAEAAKSRYEGRRLPKTKTSEKQLLPAFPECVEEATRSWGKPFTARAPAQGGAALDWYGMEEKGFSRLPPVEPLVASHLHPSQRSAMTAGGTALPSKADCLQTTLNERSYKAVATSVRALNASSLLLAYQAEIQDDITASPSAEMWEELCVVIDLCLRLHKCAVQACGRAMGVMVTQERARWLSLSSLSHRDKTEILDVPVDPKGLFGSAVATMQKRCEEKKREGEALQLCLPRKVPVSKVPSQFPPRPVPKGQAAYRNSKRPTQPQPQSSAPHELKGAWTRRPFAPRAKNGPQQGQPASHGAKKKKRDS
ncbi:unnamed protein product [Knipowitschia caucasica]